MTETFNSRIPTWFWAIGALAVLWNAMGVLAYLNQAFMSAETLASMADAERAMFETQPSWAVATFAIAVFGGFLGSFLLLLRSRWSTVLLVISFIAVLAQCYYWFAIAKVQDIYTGAQMIMPIAIPIIALLLIVFAVSSNRKGLFR